MTYLLTQMTLYMLCALLLGLFLGWLIWGRLAQRLKRAEAERVDLQNKLSNATDGSGLQAKFDAANADLALCQRERRVQDEELARLRRELETTSDASANAGTRAAGLVGSVGAGAASVATSTSLRSEKPADADVGSSQSTTVGGAKSETIGTSKAASVGSTSASPAATKSSRTANAATAASTTAEKGSKAATPAPKAKKAATSPATTKSSAKSAGTKPKVLTKARGGRADDLKLIKGVGPKMEDMLNGMGFFHFDQIAAWSKPELAWVDENLEGFKGRASRDKWISQAKILAAGGSTEFSKKKS